MNFDFSYLDIAFKNGSVITVNESDEIAQAVGVKGNKIVFVGTNEEIDQLIDEKTQVIDLKGRTLMPGINDSHYHPILNGMIGTDLDSAMVDTGFAQAKDIPSVLAILKAVTDTKAPGKWVSSMGFEATLLKEQRYPTLEELDAVAPNNPLQAITCNGHNAIYNSKALEYLKVYTAEDAKKYPEGEVVVADGKLTGEVRGHTHFWLWGQVEYTEPQQRKAAMKSQKQCLELGITSVGDMGECDAPSYHIMQKMCRDGDFKIRSYMALHSIFGKHYSLEDNEHWMKLGFVTGLGDEHFRVGPCKFMIDGGSGGPTCYTREPYSHDPNAPSERGWEREETWDYIKKVDDAECQCTAHAMGDGAIEFMVEGYEKAFAACEDKEAFKARRHRIEHCMLVDQDLIDRMAKMNICPSVNAGLQIRNGKNLARFYGPKREKFLGALKSMMEAGVVCSLHSDAPSGPVGFEMIDGAVNRYDLRQGYQCDMSQAVTVLQAIRCCTYNAAYQSYEEKIKGSVEVGKLADLIVCDRDILAMDTHELHNVKVDLTMIDGKVEYQRV
ncbi:MAG: amidohydrolase [Dysosmobacter sp.]|nr:amidohydrolase [Dysosmobacter sp.]